LETNRQKTLGAQARGDDEMLKNGMIALVILLAGPSAWGVETLSSEELLSHCNNNYYEPEAEADRIFCVRYIQGFIDGAVATDERVVQNVSRELGGEETFSERATRTRIGSRLERFGASAYAEYCLGDPVPLKEVVEHVVEDAQDPALVARIPVARDLVYQALRDHYPCPSAD
jgi:hypothetical protein